MQLSFELRSLTNRSVSITQNGAVLWHGAIGKSATPVTLSFPATDGATRLTFTTDTPGLLESENSDARSLAFAVYDPRLTLSESKP